jgi:hypothetical protein
MKNSNVNNFNNVFYNYTYEINCKHRNMNIIHNTTYIFFYLSTSENLFSTPFKSTNKIEDTTFNIKILMSKTNIFNFFFHSLELNQGPKGHNRIRTHIVENSFCLPSQIHFISTQLNYIFNNMIIYIFLKQLLFFTLTFITLLLIPTNFTII